MVKRCLIEALPENVDALSCFAEAIGMEVVADRATAEIILADSLDAVAQAVSDGKSGLLLSGPSAYPIAPATRANFGLVFGRGTFMGQSASYVAPQLTTASS